MISFKGNTGPYLQYATARIRSIFRRAGIDEAGRCAARSWSPTPAERELARKLLEFGAVVTPGRRDRRAAPALRLPVRGRQPVHLVLRAVPGPQGRRRGDQELPARAVRRRPPRADRRPRPARRAHPRPDVSAAASCRNGHRETYRHRCRSLEKGNVGPRAGSARQMRERRPREWHSPAGAHRRRRCLAVYRRPEEAEAAHDRQALDAGSSSSSSSCSRCSTAPRPHRTRPSATDASAGRAGDLASRP